MQPRGLTGLGIDTLTCSTAEIHAICTVLASPPAYPLLVHCTQGKDRTGLTVILALLLCNIPVAAIGTDYRASEQALVPERAERLKEIREIGLSEEFAGCPAGFVEAVVEWLGERGGVEGYLESVGVGAEMRARVRANLMVAEREMGKA